MTTPKKESNSRPARWERACGRARKALEEAKSAREELASAFGDLEELRSEYESWKDNLPENFQSGELADKLDTITGMDFQWDAEGDDLDSAETTLDEAEGADMPRGFGRD